MSEGRWDVAVVGAGPAGSSVAARLSRAGHRVVVLEKETFPRFHIGESLLPRSIPCLLDLGVDLGSKPFALKKEGAHFLNEGTGDWFRFDFGRTLPGCFPYAYQVVRADFDLALAQTAARFGAELRFGETVTDCVEDKAGVTLRRRSSGGIQGGDIRARYVIDATGQGALIAREHKTQDRIRGLGKCGTFTHFSGVTSPAAREAFARGDIIILVTQSGSWGWAIPLPGDRLSVGVVTRDGDAVPALEGAVDAFIARYPRLEAILDGARRDAPVRRIADYSYYNKRLATARVVSLGDAHGFLDPIFSSGITLGLYTAEQLAPQVGAACEGDLPLDLKSYYEGIERGYATFQCIIKRFYRPGWAQTTFFFEDKPEDLVRQMTTILAGDVWREDNAYQNLLLRGRGPR